MWRLNDDATLHTDSRWLDVDDLGGSVMVKKVLLVAGGIVYFCVLLCLSL